MANCRSIIGQEKENLYVVTLLSNCDLLYGHEKQSICSINQASARYQVCSTIHSRAALTPCYLCRYNSRSRSRVTAVPPYFRLFPLS
jgi:hypothetical protein